MPTTCGAKLASASRSDRPICPFVEIVKLGSLGRATSLSSFLTIGRAITGLGAAGLFSHCIPLRLRYLNTVGDAIDEYDSFFKSEVSRTNHQRKAKSKLVGDLVIHGILVTDLN